MGEAKQRKQLIEAMKSSGDWPKPVRAIVNLLALVTLPIWGGFVIAGAAWIEVFDSKGNTRALLRGQRWFWK